MKTAEEWLSEGCVHAYNHPLNHRPISKNEIQQIQLDAMKEGMRRAATVVEENNQPVFNLPTRLHTRKALGQAILTAAEQLIEKDLQ